MKDQDRIRQILDATSSTKLKKFPIDALPPINRKMAREVARNRKVAHEMTGPLAIAGLSSAVGRSILGDNLIPGFVTPPNLFFLIVAPTTVGKSSAEFFMKPIRDVEKEIDNEWKARCNGLRARQHKLKVLKEGPRRRKSGRNNDEDEEIDEDEDQNLSPVEIEVELEKIKAELANEPSLMCQDTTPEAFGVLLMTNHETLTVYSADGRAALDNMQKDKNLYLMCFSGDPYRSDRVSRAKVRLEHPCVTTALLVQSDLLGSTFGNDSIQERGLTPRFLTACCDVQAEDIDPNMPRIDATVQENYNDLLKELLRFRLKQQAPTMISGTREAVETLTRFRNENMTPKDRSFVDLLGFTRRYGEQAARVSLCLHAGLWGPACVEHPVSLETAKAAIEVVEFFAQYPAALITNAKRYIAEDMLSQIMRFIRDREIKGASNPKFEGTTNRDVYWKFKLDKDETQGYLDTLEANGLLTPTPMKKRGQSYVVYRPIKATRD